MKPEVEFQYGGRLFCQPEIVISQLWMSVPKCIKCINTLLPLSPNSIIWYQRKLGSKQAYRVVHQPESRGFAVFADAWLSGSLAEINADLRETVAHLLYFTLLTRNDA